MTGSGLLAVYEACVSRDDQMMTGSASSSETSGGWTGGGIAAPEGPYLNHQVLTISDPTGRDEAQGTMSNESTHTHDPFELSLRAPVDSIVSVCGPDVRLVIV